MTTHPCAHDPSHLIPDSSGKTFCSATCRSAHFRAKQAADAARTRDVVTLLRRQTTAVERRDSDALRATTREARTLLTSLAV
jgi:hypothetical protein